MKVFFTIQERHITGFSDGTIKIVNPKLKKSLDVTTSEFENLNPTDSSWCRF